MTDPTQAPATSRLGGPGSLRILVAGIAAAVLAVSAAVALATSAPASPVMSNASAVGPGPADAEGFIGLAAATSRDGTMSPANGPNAMGRGGKGGGHMFHAITIAAKDGSTLSLKTADGWTRTISVVSDTTITKGRVAIQLADLNVSDTIAFRQAKNTDGTFKVTEIRVIVPQVGGEVTAVSGNSLTLKLRDGTSKSITLTDSTKYFVGPKAAAKADVKVGARVHAQGTISGDTFTALSVTLQPDVVAGEVTAKTTTSITLKTRAGASVTVTVDSTTTFRISGKENATLAEVTVGMHVAAQGTKATDTTFNAFAVGSAPAMKDGRPGGRGGSGGPGGMRGPGGMPGPNGGSTGPAPSGSTGAS